MARCMPDAYINQLFRGDCLEIMKQLPDASVDMVLCDLPYGTTQNKWDSVIPLEPLWQAYRRIVKKEGAIVLTSQGVFTAKLILSNESDFKYKMVWVKSKPTNFLNAKKQPLRKYEDICVFYQKQPTYHPQMSDGKPYDKGVRKDQFTGSYGNFSPAHVESKTGQRYPTDVLYFKTPESEEEHTVWHPTQKPVELGRYLVRTFTNPGDVVLDNTCGSGSFLVAALREFPPHPRGQGDALQLSLASAEGDRPPEGQPPGAVRTRGDAGRRGETRGDAGRRGGGTFWRKSLPSTPLQRL